MDSKLRLCYLGWYKMVDDLYLIILKNSSEMKIQVGSLGEHEFDKGYYIYVGSAKRNLFSRIKRHMKKNDKSKHWHIDYLRSKVDFKGFLTFSRKKYDSECTLVNFIDDKTSYSKIVEGFGSTDSECYSHLLYSKDPDNLKFLN